jgi:hypothetical protein
MPVLRPAVVGTRGSSGEMHLQTRELLYEKMGLDPRG